MQAFKRKLEFWKTCRQHQELDSMAILKHFDEISGDFNEGILEVYLIMKWKICKPLRNSFLHDKLVCYKSTHDPLKVQDG